jgi:hypothetical protein
VRLQSGYDAVSASTPDARIASCSETRAYFSQGRPGESYSDVILNAREGMTGPIRSARASNAIFGPEA